MSAELRSRNSKRTDIDDGGDLDLGPKTIHCAKIALSRTPLYILRNQNIVVRPKPAILMELERDGTYPRDWRTCYHGPTKPSVLFWPPSVSHNVDTGRNTRPGCYRLPYDAAVEEPGSVRSHRGKVTRLYKQFLGVTRLESNLKFRGQARCYCPRPSCGCGLHLYT